VLLVDDHVRRCDVRREVCVIALGLDRGALHLATDGDALRRLGRELRLGQLQRSPASSSYGPAMLSL
jgi:hypothetical protein